MHLGMWVCVYWIMMKNAFLSVDHIQKCFWNTTLTPPGGRQGGLLPFSVLGLGGIHFSRQARRPLKSLGHLSDPWVSLWRDSVSFPTGLSVAMKSQGWVSGHQERQNWAGSKLCDWIFGNFGPRQYFLTSDRTWVLPSLWCLSDARWDWLLSASSSVLPWLLKIHGGWEEGSLTCSERTGGAPWEPVTF